MRGSRGGLAVWSVIRSILLRFPQQSSSPSPLSTELFLRSIPTDHSAADLRKMSSYATDQVYGHVWEPSGHHHYDHSSWYPESYHHSAYACENKELINRYNGPPYHHHMYPESSSPCQYDHGTQLTIPASCLQPVPLSYPQEVPSPYPEPVPSPYSQPTPVSYSPSLSSYPQSSSCTQASSQSKSPRKGSSNKKERRRTVSINSAFSSLRQRIPNVPEDTKLSKIKTLRLATSYISYLMNILDDDNQSGASSGSEARGPEVFTPDLQKLKRSRASSSSISAALASSSSSSSDHQNMGYDTSFRTSSGRMGGKGRTGWPADVWQHEVMKQDLNYNSFSHKHSDDHYHLE